MVNILVLTSNHCGSDCYGLPMKQEAKSISVVIPVFNGGPWIFETLTKLDEALQNSRWCMNEIIVVDDGSTDETVQEVIRFNLENKSHISIISQDNLGRFMARSVGLQDCSGEFVLFLDARVRLESDSLSNAYQITDKHAALTCHITYSQQARILGFFWSAAEKIFWARYWNNPMDNLVTTKNFDDFPKGTTSLILERNLAMQAFTSFESKVSDLRNASDDTQPLYLIAEKCGIFISPEYSATYVPRENLIQSLKHAHHRGVVFYDGHLARHSKLWRKFLVLALSGASVLLLLISLFPIKFLIGFLIIIDCLIPVLIFKSIRWKPWISLNLYSIPFASAWLIGLIKTIFVSIGNSR
jgi:glycosyltransferase involved in cell wall biosynthesis